MEISITCEVIQTQGCSFFADLVRILTPRGALPRDRLFNHFHPEAELVWYRRVSGRVFVGNAELPLSDHQAMFIPSMTVHASDTGAAPAEWVLLQFDPVLVGAIQRHPAGRHLADPRLISLNPLAAARMDMLCDWLLDMRGKPAQEAEARRALELILLLVAGGVRQEDQPLISAAGPTCRLQPAITLIHADVGRMPDLTGAARACNLTPSYFSRLFKAQMGMGFSAYVQMHRLNLAARRLRESGDSIAQVAYGLGFSSPAYFSTAFIQRFGISPRDYRRLGLSQRTRVQEIETLPQEI
jgi:AraC-like DNA-binding protein